jgi:LSD1 subclass zinc finger protein
MRARKDKYIDQTVNAVLLLLSGEFPRGAAKNHCSFCQSCGKVYILRVRAPDTLKMEMDYWTLYNYMLCRQWDKDSIC